MKRLGLLFLSLSTVFAQEPAVDFLTGQAARITIGQTTFTSQASGNPSSYQLGAVDGVAFANNTLFVVDSNHLQIPPVNNRVLIFSGVSNFIHNPSDEIPQGGRCPVCIGSPSLGASVVLGQPDFASVTDPNTTQSGFRTPTGIASDGKILVVADTDNNRVLIWKEIPASINQPADIVLGQKDFTTVQEPPPLDSSSFRGPEGVWVQGTQLFVADVQNHRGMVWNSTPPSNNQPADLVLGEPNFSTAPPATTSDLVPTASNLFSPVSVTSDGTHLFVTDLGHHRVLIWNSIPTQNGQAADVVVGQANMTSELDNGNIASCVSTGTDADGNPTYAAGCPTVICPTTGTDSNGTPLYPGRCGVTLSYPRFALSDGNRLFVADGGNDRVLVFNKIPTQNDAEPDNVLGQPDEFSSVVSSTTSLFMPLLNQSASDITPTPTSLA